MLKRAFASGPAIIAARPRSFELMGVDVMIDDRLEPWIIEVNASPSMETATSVTAAIIPQVSEDLAKMIIDEDFGDREPQKTLIGRFEPLLKLQPYNPIESGFKAPNLAVVGKRIANLSII